MEIILGISIIINKSFKKPTLKIAHKAKEEKNSTFQGILRGRHLNGVSLRCQREN